MPESVKHFDKKTVLYIKGKRVRKHSLFCCNFDAIIAVFVATLIQVYYRMFL